MLRVRRWQRRLDLALAALVLVLAFLVSSVLVRNSDFWLHLATGRLLATGAYHFGVDPFAYTTQNVYWANHSWLFDWLLYGLYERIGGAGLVVLKALLITVLAGLLLSIRRAGSPLVWPAVWTTLTLLAMSPRLLLQPACVSYFLLGLTLWILWRLHGRPATEDKQDFTDQLRRNGPLLLLFALWVNVDSWFLLGPVLVGLFLLGEYLQGLLTGSNPQARIPAWLLPASVAVCLLNPHHVHAFTLPLELSPVLAQAGLTQDPRFQRLLSSPWQVGLRPWPAAAGDLTTWAYFVLVGMGLLSFALERARLSGWRLTVWLTFAALGAWQLRTVPFFAVVAGPITALNLQDYFARQKTEAEREQRGLILGRVALLGVGLGLLAMTWAGWLQGIQVEAGRAVGWGVQVDPSLEHTAARLRQWHQQGKLAADQHVFPFDPETADYLAWYCPEVKTFIDHRFGLFAHVAREYEEVCRALNPALDVGGGRPRVAGGWRKIFRDWGITCLVLHDRHEPFLLPGVDRLVSSSDEWALLEVDGQAVIGGWKGGSSFGALGFNPELLAWHAQEKDSTLPPAPGVGPGRGPQPPTLWGSFVRPRGSLAWESTAATIFLRYAEQTGPQERKANTRHAVSMFLAGVVGLPAMPAAGPSAQLGMAVRLQMPRMFLGDVTDRSPALPLLAVRAARRALVDNPEDANAYLRLGQAYLALRNDSPEHSREGRLAPLAMLRHIQIATALEEALLLYPGLEAAHENLATLYLEHQYLDVALEHRQARLELMRKTLAGGNLSRERAEALGVQLAQLEKSVADLEAVVQDRQNKFAIRSDAMGDDPLHKAELALSLGLPRKALDDVLLRSQVLLFGAPGARLELQLLLLLGRAEEARQKLEDPALQESRHLLEAVELPGTGPRGETVIYRFPAYAWLVGCQAAATGDYDRAADAFAEGAQEMAQSLVLETKKVKGPLLAATASEVGMMALPQASLFAALANNLDLASGPGRLRELAHQNGAQADLVVVSGMVELERGRPDAARQHFEEALDLCKPGSLGDNFAGRPLAVGYLQRLRAAAPR